MKLFRGDAPPGDEMESPLESPTATGMLTRIPKHRIASLAVTNVRDPTRLTRRPYAHDRCLFGCLSLTL